ncbi:hypothetical protein Tco_1000749 [Tanacetum coccineum]
MKRGFRGAPRPLLPAMLLVATNPNAGQEHQVVPQTQPSASTPSVPSTSSPPVQSPPQILASIPTPTPIPDPEPEPFEHTFEEPSPPGNGSQTNQADNGECYCEVSQESEEVGRVFKEEKYGLVTPSTTKVDASGEEQVEDISPNTLEAAKTLSRVASLKPKSIDKGRRYKRRRATKGKKVVSSLDFQEEVDTGAEQVNTAEGVNTGSIKLSTVSAKKSKSTPSPDKGQREGKAHMISEETPKKSNS